MKSFRSNRRFVSLFILFAMLLAITTACAAPTQAPAAEAPAETEAPAPTEAPQATEPPETKAASPEALLSDLPAELQALYQNTTDPIADPPYEDIGPVDTPWKICFADSYQGNPWRVSVNNELKRLSEEFTEAGKVSGYEVSVSGGDVAQQISQIRAFIDKDCSVILTIPESATGINEAIKAAYDAGIPVISFAGAVTSPYAINVDSNYWRWGYDMMKGIAERLDGEGNVLMVEGIAGQPIVAQERQGAQDALEEHPDLEPVAWVNGDWTPSVTKSVVLQTLATHPEQIDAVWTTGSESRLVAEAFNEAGRPAPLITGSTSGDALGYWKENPDNYRFYGHAVLPSWTAQTAFRVAVRILEGQNPKISTIMIPIPEVTQESLGDWYRSCMTPDSGSVFPIAPEDPMPADLMNAYFEDGKAVEPYDYASTPDPCAQAQ